MNELYFFMEKSAVEQRLRLSERVTTIEEFWQYRLGTSAVRVVLAINELVISSLEPAAWSLLTSVRFCNNIALPPDILEDEDMTILCDLTNINICRYVHAFTQPRWSSVGLQMCNGTNPWTSHWGFRPLQAGAALVGRHVCHSDPEEVQALLLSESQHNTPKSFTHTTKNH